MNAQKKLMFCCIIASAMSGGCIDSNGPDLRDEERLAVEEILLLNGLDTVPWERVVSERDIDGKRTGHIQKLILYGREIDTIPPSIRFLTHVKAIALEDNNLAGLPIEFSSLKPLQGEVNLKGNRLCSISGPLRDWLDKYSAGWAESQHCP